MVEAAPGAPSQPCGGRGAPSDMKDATDSPDTNGGQDYLRGSDGRFSAGNRGGPGSGRGRRIREYREAIRAAASAEDVAAVVAKLVELARAGDVAASREVLDRVLGRPGQAVDPVGLSLPQIKCSADASAAASEILRALGEGEVSAEEASRVGTLLGVALRAVELSQIEERLDALEKRSEARWR